MCCSHCLTTIAGVADLLAVGRATKGGGFEGENGTRVEGVRAWEGTTRCLDAVLPKLRQLPQSPMLRRGARASRSYDPTTAIDITPSEGFAFSCRGA